MCITHIDRFDVNDATPPLMAVKASAKQAPANDHCAQRVVKILRNAAEMFLLPHIQSIRMMFSRSPCFHQHCVPQCEVG